MSWMQSGGTRLGIMPSQSWPDIHRLPNVPDETNKRFGEEETNKSRHRTTVFLIPGVGQRQKPTGFLDTSYLKRREYKHHPRSATKNGRTNNSTTQTDTPKTVQSDQTNTAKRLLSSLGIPTKPDTPQIDPSGEVPKKIPDKDTKTKRIMERVRSSSDGINKNRANKTRVVS